MTYVSDFDPSWLLIDQVSFKSDKLITDDIKYYKDLSSSNPLYLVFNNLDAYMEKSGKNKFLLRQIKMKWC